MKDSLAAKIIESIGWIIIIFSIIIPLILGIIIAIQSGEIYDNNEIMQILSGVVNITALTQLGLWTTIITMIISGSVFGIMVIGFSKIINNTYQNKEVSYRILKELQQQKRPPYFNSNNQ